MCTIRDGVLRLMNFIKCLHQLDMAIEFPSSVNFRNEKIVFFTYNLHVLDISE